MKHTALALVLAALMCSGCATGGFDDAGAKIRPLKLSRLTSDLFIKNCKPLELAPRSGKWLVTYPNCKIEKSFLIPEYGVVPWIEVVAMWGEMRGNELKDLGPAVVEFEVPYESLRPKEKTLADGNEWYEAGDYVRILYIVQTSESKIKDPASGEWK